MEEGSVTNMGPASHSNGLVSINDLDEGVHWVVGRTIHSVASLAVVEVSAHVALVANASQGRLSTPVANDTCMHIIGRRKMLVDL